MYDNWADFHDLRYFLLHTQPHSLFLRYPEIVSQLEQWKHQFKMTHGFHIVTIIITIIIAFFFVL